LGEQIKVVQGVLLTLETGHGLVTTPRILNNNGLPVFRSPKEEIDTLIAFGNELEDIITEGQLSPMVTATLQDVLNDIARHDLRMSSGNLDTDQRNFARWYGDQQVQNNFPRAIQAAAGLSRQRQNDLKSMIFLLEQILKGGAAMLSGIDQTQTSLSTGIGQ
jgi:hypothetical protein